MKLYVLACAVRTFVVGALDDGQAHYNDTTRRLLMIPRRLLVLVLIASVQFGLHAQERPNVRPSEKQRVYEAELRKLKESDPAKYAKGRRAFTLFAEILLGRMGYGVGPFDGVLSESDQERLRAYEQKRGLPVTGDPLAFRTMEQVSKDLNALDYSPVSLPTFILLLSSWDEGYVSADGTWVLVNETQAFPEQAVKLECFRDIGVCAEATVRARAARWRCAGRDAPRR
jgi:hypothetical protein